MALMWLKKRFEKGLKSQSGLALILILSLVVVIISVVAEIVFQAEITSRSSISEQNKAKAEMAAITGSQFARLLVTLELGIQALPAEVKQIVSMQLGSLSISKLLNDVPIGAEAMEQMKELGGAKFMSFLDPQVLEVLKAVPGYFSIHVSNESAKLNLNLLSKPDAKVNTKELVGRLFGGQRESKFLENKGFPPERLLANLIDYVDKNNSDENDQADESIQYAALNFKHGPKNGPFESLEELRRVPGFHDDDIYAIFSPYFTVWPMAPEEKSLDINEAPIELVSSFLTVKGTEVNDQDIDKLEDFREEGSKITEQRALTDFLDKMSTGNNSQALKKIANFESPVYRIEVTGVSGGVTRTYLLVLEKVKRQTNDNSLPIRVVYQRFM